MLFSSVVDVKVRMESKDFFCTHPQTSLYHSAPHSAPHCTIDYIACVSILSCLHVSNI